MKTSSFNLLSTNSRIGISVDSDSLDSKDNSEGMPKYALFNFPRLSVVNSFLIIDEQFYIGKKEYDGKEKDIYHVYRVSDKRYICPSVLGKEETIKMVTRRWIELEV